MSVPSRREKLEQMLAADPADQTLRYMLAMELDKAGQHDRSLQYLQSLMQDAVPYVPAFLMAGQQLTRLGRNAEAATCYHTGIVQAQQQNNSHAASEMTSFLQALQDLGG